MIQVNWLIKPNVFLTSAPDGSEESFFASATFTLGEESWVPVL